MGTNKITQGEWMLNKNKLIIYTRVQFDVQMSLHCVPFIQGWGYHQNKQKQTPKP